MSSWINQSDITRIINQLQPNKAPGPNAITVKMFKNIPVKAKKFLVNLYDKIITHSYVPNKWCTLKAIFIPKNNLSQKVTLKHLDQYAYLTYDLKFWKN
jgi:hypothetical protein